MYELTSVDVLLDEALDGALVHLGRGLRLERPAVLAGIEHAGRVHGPLERVTLPTEDVVGMGAVAVIIAVAHGERLGAVGGPKAVELGGVPESLVGNLGHADGVRGRAGTSSHESSTAGIVHVGLVVRAVLVLSIPASKSITLVKFS